MTSRFGSNLATFAPSDADGVSLALTPEGTIAWRPGLKPDVWSFRCSYRELAKLKGDVGRVGQLRLYDRNCPADDATDSGGTLGPDVTIAKVRIVDCQPIDQRVVPTESTATIYVEYRLTMADFRQRYVSPRGGRLKVGLVNPKKGEAVAFGDGEEPDGDDRVRMTFAQMLEACLKAMGLTGLTLPAGVEDVDPPEDVKWFGNHAPTELDKLLKRARYVFVPHLDGTASVEAIGTGTPPTFRAGDALPELRAPSIDRRGRTVVVTSYPTRVVETWELTGPGSGWDFAMQDGDAAKTWRRYDQLTKLPKVMESEVRTILAGVEEKLLLRVADQLYRFVWVDTGDVPPALGPVLARTLDKDGKPGKPSFKGTVAVKHPDTGLWNNRDNVEVPIVRVRAGNILELAQLVGRVERDGVDVFVPANFRQMTLGSGTVTYSAEMAEVDASGEKPKARPVYFEAGFTKEAGAISRLPDGDAQNALAGSDDDVVVVTDPTLQLRVYNGQERNREELVARAQALADALLGESGVEIRTLPARGYQTAELSGVVSKVTWDPAKFSTEVELANWWAPGSALDPERYREKLEQAYPNQADTQADRAAAGTAGDRPDVMPLGNPQSIPAAAGQGFIPCLVTVDGGVAGGDPSNTGTAVDCSWTYKLFTLRAEPIQQKRSGTLQQVDKLTPACKRLPLTEYVRPPDLSLGVAYRDQEGTIKLYHVAAEIPAIRDCPTSGGG